MNNINIALEKNMEEQIAFFRELLKMNTEKAAPVKENDNLYPFGEGVQKAYELTMSKAREMGFKTENMDNYGGHIDFGEGDEILGIIGHLDVVPAGEGWEFEPYSGDMSEGYIYGRGTTDDKGPVVACLYAMKALKDAGWKPAKKIRLILGLDEETDWDGLTYYLDHVSEKPDFGFSPDGEFPVINGEKGIMDFDLVRKVSENRMKGLELRNIEGGDASNMVPEKARAVVNLDDEGYDEIKEKIAAFAEKTSYSIEGRGIGKSFEIKTEGKAAHGASPEKGLNAISILMEFLGELNFADEKTNELIEFYNTCIAFDVNGGKIGCGFSDEKSGKLTFNAGVISMEKAAVRIQTNVRIPITYTAEDVYEAMGEATGKYDIGIVKKSYKEPIFMDTDTPMVKTMLETYRDHTGDDTEPLVIGGGTYSRAFTNMLAYGAAFPGDPDLMHQRNEKISVDNFKKMTEIYADAIYRLTQEDFHL